MGNLHEASIVLLCNLRDVAPLPTGVVCHLKEELSLILAQGVEGGEDGVTLEAKGFPAPGVCRPEIYSVKSLL